MYLLHSKTSPNPQFASLTLLLSDNGSFSMGEPLLLAAPFSTMCVDRVGDVLCELHEYLGAVSKGTASSVKESDDDWMTSQWSSEDSAKLLDDVQVFRPSINHGIGLYYYTVRTSSIVRKVLSVVLQQTSTKNDSVVGLVLCVGLSGLSYAQSSAPLQYSLPQRMRDCFGVLVRLGSSSTTDFKDRQMAAKALLTTMLLTEDEMRKTSAMVDAEQSVMIPEPDTVSGSDGALDRISSTLMTPLNAVQQGGLTVVQGGLTVVHGGLFVVQGGLNVVSGGINAVTGGALQKSTGGLLLKTNLLKNIRARTTSKKDIDITDLRLESESNASSADVARVLAERLAVVSVVEKDTILRRYEVMVAEPMARRCSMGPGVGKVKRVARRRRSEKKCADLNDFDYAAPPVVASVTGTPVIAEVDEGRSAKSFATSTLRAPTNDTAAKRSSVPMLMAPRNDKGGNRRSSQPLRRKSSSRNFDQKEEKPGDFSSFDVFGSEQKEDENQGIHFPGFNNDGNTNGADPWGPALRKDGPDKSTPSTNGFDPFGDLMGHSKPQSVSGEGTVTTAASTHSGSSAPSTSRRSRAMPYNEDIDLTQAAGGTTGPHLPFYAARPDGSNNLEMKHSDRLEDLYESFRNSHWATTPADEELVDLAGTRRLQVVPGAGGADSRPQVQVNIALNEDLTCSYKQSRMASCTIEGVVQVQVKMDGRGVGGAGGAPFFLIVSDPLGHIGALQENRKYADDMSEALADDEESTADHKFTVSVPKADNYFPVMRYKCSNELRPVPIRVQTRVRLNGGFCRVALQISSNPSNRDNLTDLTIIMGVPPDIRGETLTTSPSGGVWNVAKRSVIWCVAELGHGEKFQLQAQFEVDPDRVADLEKEKPSFPVLVRCQCMYAQLSDIRLQVSDIPEVFPADVTMKLARRFRLSHRERS